MAIHIIYLSNGFGEKKKRQVCQVYVLQTVIKCVSLILVWLFGLERSLESTIQIYACLDLP